MPTVEEVGAALGRILDCTARVANLEEVLEHCQACLCQTREGEKERGMLPGAGAAAGTGADGTPDPSV